MTSNGNHVNGMAPSDDGDGTTTAANWTSFTHTGGASSPDTYTDVWAVCIDGA